MQDVTGTENIEQPVLRMGPQEGLHRKDHWERLYKRADFTKMRRCSLSRVGKALDKGREAYRQVREGSVWRGGQGQSARLEKERREHSSWSGTAGRVALAEGSRAWGGPTAPSPSHTQPPRPCSVVSSFLSLWGGAERESTNLLLLQVCVCSVIPTGKVSKRHPICVSHWYRLQNEMTKHFVLVFTLRTWNPKGRRLTWIIILLDQKIFVPFGNAF